MEITNIFGKQETVRSRRGWDVGPEDTFGMGNEYIVGPLIVYDETGAETQQADATENAPKTYALSPFKADSIRSPAWAWTDDSIDYRVEVIQEQSPVGLYSARSPAWDLCGD